jgi:hypothetical protein
MQRYASKIVRFVPENATSVAYKLDGCRKAACADASCRESRRPSSATRFAGSRPRRPICTRTEPASGTRRSRPSPSCLDDRAEQLKREPDKVYPETYQWMLVPVQANPQASVTFQATRLSGGEPLAVRASKKLKSEELLVTSLGPTILRMHLDGPPALWPDAHVSVRQLVDYFAT